MFRECYIKVAIKRNQVQILSGPATVIVRNVNHLRA